MRATVFLVLGLLLLAPGASAKGGVGGLRFCGAGGCWDVNDPSAVTELLRAVADGRTAGPTAPSPYFSVRYLDHVGGVVRPRARAPELYYVPRAAVVRRSVGVRKWAALGAAKRHFERAVWGWTPFRPSRLTRVEVDGRLAREPASYILLYQLTGPSARDPAGARRPAEGRVRYLERRRRHWLPVDVRAARATPWGDGVNELWVGRRLDLLERDGEVLRVPAALAERARHGASLRGLGP